MKLQINENNDYLIEMANVVGKYVKRPNKLPFSFYFSAQNNSHSIRVKPSFNAKRLIKSQIGTLKLCDDWEFVPGKDDTDVNQKEIAEMKNFFRKYLVLFCAVWDMQLSEYPVQKYFEGAFSLQTVIEDMDFYDSDMDKIKTIEELEKYCRDHNLVNFYGN
jgi:hypothetical protein